MIADPTHEAYIRRLAMELSVRAAAAGEHPETTINRAKLYADFMLQPQGPPRSATPVDVGAGPTGAMGE